MPFGVAEAGEVVSTTLRSRTGELVDNTTQNNALLSILKKRGKIKPWRGGRTILQEIHYSGNTTYKRYRGYENLNVTPSEVIGSYEFDPKYVAIAVSISGEELLLNYGEAQVIDLLDGRIENAMAEASNGMSADCYSDGTADGGKQVGGLQLLISSNPATGTVGGANRATWTFARNQRYQATTDGGAVKSATNIVTYMDRLWLLCTRGSDVPDLVVMDNNDFAFFEGSVHPLQRITDATNAEVGWQGYKYKGAGVIADGGIGGDMPANTSYFINTKYLFLRPHEDRNMDVIGGDRVPVQQDAMIRIIGWAGNMTGSNFQLQGVLLNT